MPPRNQVELEFQLGYRWNAVDNRHLSLTEAFGNQEEWLLQLGERKAFLHPEYKQWMWYDRLHKEWVFAECGVGEGILLTAGNSGGVKKLPQPGKVEDWAVYRTKEEFFGPLLVEDLLKHLETLENTRGVKIWSPKADRWLSATEFKKLTKS